MNPRLVRTLYLYLFAAIGLGLMVIATVQLVDLGLRTVVFRSADIQPPAQPATIVERIIADENIDLVTLNTNLAECGDKCKLTKDEQTVVQNWIADYKEWQENNATYDAVKIRRQRVASSSIAAFLIGFPIFLYHWLIIRRELRSKKEESSDKDDKEQEKKTDDKKDKKKADKKEEKEDKKEESAKEKSEDK
ncbi:hypothetical protein ACFL1U_02190 [Patescibacteria group bacterium]